MCKNRKNAFPEISEIHALKKSFFSGIAKLKCGLQYFGQSAKLKCHEIQNLSQKTGN